MDTYRSQLQGFIKRLNEAISVLRGPSREVAESLQNLLGQALLMIALSDEPAGMAGGKYTTGKSSAFKRFLAIDLDGDRGATTRLFTAIRAVVGTTRPRFRIVRLGRAECRRVLELYVERLPREVQPSALRTLRRSPDPRAAARRLVKLFIKAVGSIDDADDRRRVAEIAFYCVSISRYLPDRDSLSFEEIGPELGLDESGVAKLYHSWGGDKEGAGLKYVAGTPRTGDDLRRELASWFRGHPRLRPFEGLPGYAAIRRRYEITLQLGVLLCVLVDVEPAGPFVDGSVWWDTPGVDYSTHDAVQSDMCLGAASRGIVFDSLSRPGGDWTRRTHDRLAQYGARVGFAFSMGDEILEKDLATSLKDLAGDGDAASRACARILGRFTELTEAADAEGPARRILDADDPESSDRFILLNNEYEKSPTGPEARALARFLHEPDIRAMLPAASRRLLESMNGHLTPLPFPSGTVLPRRAAARLAAAVVELATDGGLDRLRRVMIAMAGEPDPRPGRLDDLAGRIETLATAGLDGLEEPSPADHARHPASEQAGRVARRWRAAIDEIVPALREQVSCERIARLVDAYMARVAAPAAAEDPRIREFLQEYQAAEVDGARTTILDDAIDAAPDQEARKAIRAAARGASRRIAAGRPEDPVSLEVTLDGLARRMRGEARSEPCRAIARRYMERLREQLPRDLAGPIDAGVTAVVGLYRAILERELGALFAAVEAPAGDAAARGGEVSDLELARLALARRGVPTLAATLVELDETFRRDIDESLSELWTDALQAIDGVDPMASAPTELFDPDRHITRFRDVAGELVRRRLGLVFLDAARRAADAELRLKEQLARIESALAQPELEAVLAGIRGADPAEKERLRRAEARRALRDVLQSAPAALRELAGTLAGFLPRGPEPGPVPAPAAALAP